MTKNEYIDTIKVLRKEVEILTKRLQPAGTGYLITAIDVINGRIDEMMEELTDNNDNYEHTKEYYDKNRNRPVESLL